MNQDYELCSVFENPNPQGKDHTQPSSYGQCFADFTSTDMHAYDPESSTSANEALYDLSCQHFDDPANLGLQESLVMNSIEGASSALSEASDSSAITIIPYLKHGERMFTAIKRQLRWGSIEQAKEAADGRALDYDPPYDASKPVSLVDQQAYVLLLLDAIYDTSSAQDNSKNVQQWETRVDSGDHKIEAGVWRLLEKLLQYHSQPRPLGEDLHRRSEKKPKFDCFAEHVEVLCEVLRHQKTICRRFLQEDPLNSLVHDPYGREERVRSNRKGNNKKKEDLQKKTQAIALLRQGEQAETDGEDGDGSGELGTENRCKRKAGGNEHRGVATRPEKRLRRVRATAYDPEKNVPKATQ